MSKKIVRRKVVTVKKEYDKLGRLTCETTETLEDDNYVCPEETIIADKITNGSIKIGNVIIDPTSIRSC